MNYQLNYSAISSQPPFQNSTQKLIVTLRLAVYRQSVRLGANHIETHDQYFFNWTLAVIVLMQHDLWWKAGSVLYNSCWPSFLQVSLRTSRHGPHRKHRYCIVQCSFVAVGTCLPSCCLEMCYIIPFIKNPLSQQLASFSDRYLATDIQATM
jgi:hypothetical protein